MIVTGGERTGMDDEKTYSVGELAKATGLTVRTLQHYDNIGLLPTSGRTEGGRRYYTKRDVVRLTQITIYKSIGFLFLIYARSCRAAGT